ncbi:TPA_asm: hypothetical protein HUJ06_031765 [Nelumbo nucifera]|uniref:Dof zinc finger protein n=1 Tax=Nelumbo nucifera TaxID=4432 RepID=A0A822ZUT2_NELNU|nr:TPA_asm: hypothetical protein HUJ06_031765 [Nelumbo nucifera]
MDHRWKPTVEVAPNCPRCASANTKFCYYNNYSLSQPRYFCKGCRRYWTKGGSLRNVPIGGGCRKTRRAKSSKFPPTKAVSISLLPRFFWRWPVIGCESNGGANNSSHGCFKHRSCHCFCQVLESEFKFGGRCVSQHFHSSNSNELAEDSNVVDWQSQTDLAIDAHLIKEPRQLFPGQLEFDCKQKQDSSGFQPLVSDGTAQDAFWWEAPAVPNLAWQPVEFQGLETIPSNDHLTMFYPNSLNNKWSSFDTLNYESLSRP